MRKIKSSYNYGRTGKHGLKRRSKNNTSGAFGKPRKKRKILPSVEAYESRIADLEKKLTETIKLLGERSREAESWKRKSIY